MADQPSHPSPATGEGASPLRAEKHGAARWLISLATVAGVALSLHQLFNLQLFGVVMIEGMYLYVLTGIFLGIAFLCFPAVEHHWQRIPWYHWVLTLAAFVSAGYFAATADLGLEAGWEYAPPETARWTALALYLLILEGIRRAGGLPRFCIVCLFSIHPTFADRMPDPLSGFASPFMDVVPYHMISSESAFGIPMRAFGGLVIGFIVFGVVLQRTGGGKFFNDLAFALVGRDRGGAARVAIVASGFMGSMSGSVISTC